MRPYQGPGIVLDAGGTAGAEVVKALQRDLRALGYLARGIDGRFGPACTSALRALQFDLLHNDGSGSDGRAPVAVTSFNVDGAVKSVDGVFSPALAECIAAMLGSGHFPELPSSPDPKADNSRALTTILAAHSGVAPSPFIAAIALQESGAQHFGVPPAGDDDAFIIVGTDRNGANDQISSRGYGIGQYTLFHHPPQASEVADFMVDPLRNVLKAQTGLRAKFDRTLVGPDDRADDRQAEHPVLPLRLCRYPASDVRYLSDCVACARAAPKRAIAAGTPFFAGSKDVYAATPYYAMTTYAGVPDRAAFLCDWPYAVRRYNGAGVNSYHYQTHVLLNLASKLSPAEPS